MQLANLHSAQLVFEGGRAHMAAIRYQAGCRLFAHSDAGAQILPSENLDDDGLRCALSTSIMKRHLERNYRGYRYCEVV
jgi:hypothetical protein